MQGDLCKMNDWSANCKFNTNAEKAKMLQLENRKHEAPEYRMNGNSKSTISKVDSELNQ